MPTYLYFCPGPHGEFEEFHSMSKTLEHCPKCEEEKLEPQKLKQLINCSSKGVVELYGQDLVDKCKNDAKKIQKEASTNANIYSNLIGEDKYQQLQTKLDRRGR